LSRHSGADLGVGGVEILAGTRLESHVAVHFACDAALTVELALQQPIVAEIASIGQRRQHKRDRHADIVSRGRRGAHAAKAAMSTRHRSLRRDPGYSGLDPVVWYGPSGL
jgi:hypothetical protein